MKCPVLLKKVEILNNAGLFCVCGAHIPTDCGGISGVQCCATPKNHMRVLRTNIYILLLSFVMSLAYMFRLPPPHLKAPP